VSPQFIVVTDPDPDPRVWDLALAAGSQLINAGNPAVMDLDSSRADIGAHGGPKSWP
jgi:hypothetical protein